jgi:predicted small integral membrane protein
VAALACQENRPDFDGQVDTWDQALGSVAAVTSMSTFEGGADSWQAMTSPLLSWLGALFIVSGKLATGVLCTIGARLMWRARGGDAANFALAKQYALTGCAVGAIMLFGGFLVIGESWFELWRTEGPFRMALTDAYRYAGLLMLIAIFVGQTDE